MTPKISVIIPTYNRADMLGDAIASVLAQTYADWELIVVDDGSTDDTGAVVARYSDPRIRYIYQENRKLPGARNTGIRASTGEYIALLDSDDIFLPPKLQLQISAMENDPEVGLIASGWHEVDTQQRIMRTVCPWQFQPALDLNQWLLGCPFAPSTVLVKRSWLMAAGLFDEDQHYVEDWDLWLRLAYAGCTMAWAPAVVCLYTIHEGNMVNNAARMTEGVLRLFDKFFAQPDLPQAIIRRKDPIYANAHLHGAVRFLGAGDTSNGRWHLQQALALDPALLQGAPPRIIQSLASTALTHQVHDRERFVADVCHVLPQLDPSLRWPARRFRAAIAATAAFEHAALGDQRTARQMAWRSLAMDPGWLRNRGLFKIALTS
ncbi:MAG: glycosyltransferase [Anaerolineae bacterium]